MEKFINIKTATRHTMENHIMYAVRNNSPDLLAEVLEHNKHRHDQDELCQALHVTARKGYEECSRLLLDAGAHPDVHDMSGFTAVLLAAKFGHVNIIRILTRGRYKCNINKANYRVRATALHWAATNGHLLCVQELLSAGADKARRTYQGRTALMLAARSGHVDVVEELITAGSDVTVCDVEGATAAHMAAEEGCVMILSLLHEAGVDLNVQKKSGDTALVLAARNGHCDMVELLLSLGAKVKMKGQSMNAIHWAAQSGNSGCVQTLLDTPDMDVDLHTTDICYTSWTVINTGTTPLMLAAREGHCDVIKLLVQYGACVDAMDEEHMTSLLLAAKYNKHRSVDTLVLLGASVDGVPIVAAENDTVISSERGMAPLFMAIKENSVDAVKSLLRGGCSLRVLALQDDDTLCTALEFAMYLHRVVIAQLLLTVDTQVYVIDHDIVKSFTARVSRQDEYLERWFTVRLENDVSLMELCRKVIRASMRNAVADDNTATKLPLPTRLVEFIQLRELDDM